MFTFEVSQRAILAAYTHAGVKDVRYYLNGVCIDTRAGRMVATDGSRMFVCAGPKTEPGAQYILPARLLDRIKKIKSKSDVILTVKIDGMAVTVADSPLPCADTFTDSLIDARYPDYARVIPATFSGEPGQFNLQFLADAASALALYYGTKKAYAGFVGTIHNGTGPALVHAAERTKDGHTDAFAIVMPARGDFSIGPELAAFIANNQTVPEAAENAAVAA